MTGDKPNLSDSRGVAVSELVGRLEAGAHDLGFFPVQGDEYKAETMTLAAEALTRLSAEREEAVEVIAAYSAAYERIGADSFDGIDDLSRELLENAHSRARLLAGKGS